MTPRYTADPICECFLVSTLAYPATKTVTEQHFSKHLETEILN